MTDEPKTPTPEPKPRLQPRPGWIKGSSKLGQMFAIVGAPKGKLEPSPVETERPKLKFPPNGVDVTAQHLGKTSAVIGASPSKPAETPDMRDTTQDHTFIEKPRLEDLTPEEREIIEWTLKGSSKNYDDQTVQWVNLILEYARSVGEL